jgi:hypothetical protein
MKMYKWCWAIAAALLPIAATAGSYHLVEGQGRAVCEAFLKNLNAFPPNTPMSCKRRINSKYRSIFSRPEWHTLNPWKHIDKLWKFDVYSDSVWGKQEGVTKMTKGEWLKWYKKRMRGHGDVPVLMRGQFDLDDNGDTDVVMAYGYKTPACMRKSEPKKPKLGNGYFLFVKNPETGDFYYAAPHGGLPFAYDVFIFDRDVYLTSWIMGGIINTKNNSAVDVKGQHYVSYISIYSIESYQAKHGAFASIGRLCQYKVILPLAGNHDSRRGNNND